MRPLLPLAGLWAGAARDATRLILSACMLTGLPMLSACGGGDASPSQTADMRWPASQPGESPPPAPAEVEAVIGNLDALAGVLPTDALSSLFDPLALGMTVRDLTDPDLAAFQVRATLAQLQDGSRLEQVYHRYGHPDFNDQVALVPVHFDNRYGTPLYGEIVLPYRGQRPPADGPYPVILALEGLNTNVGMYRWWHQAFADAGYLVFAFDFSGQGQSDDEVDGDPGNNVEDAIDALDWLLQSSPVVNAVDPARIGVIGHSMGAITTLALQAVEPRLKAAVAAAPISEAQAPFEANPIPVMIQTGDHDGPIAPIPFVNPAVVRPIYDKLNPDRAFIVAEAASHAQHTNYPLLPTSTWGHDIAAQYSLAWMDLHLRGDTTAIEILRTAHSHLSYLWDSEVDVHGEITVLRGDGPGL